MEIKQLSLRMDLDVIEWAQAELLAGKIPEPMTLSRLQKTLAPGGVFVDIGAHVGVYSLVAAQCVGRTGRVIAIEPQPNNCASLLRNAELNDANQIEVVIGAIGATSTSVRLATQSQFDRSRLSIHEPGVNDLAQYFHVRCVPMDELCGSLGIQSIDVMKIDVEGGELIVLEGAEKVLPKNIVIEVLNNAGIETQVGLADWLDRFGYQCEGVDGTSWIPGETLHENNLWCSRK